MSKETGKLVGSLLGVVVVIMAIIGWIMNIVAICGSDFNEITGLLILRCIGVFVAPLGAVVGWI